DALPISLRGLAKDLLHGLVGTLLVERPPDHQVGQEVDLRLFERLGSFTGIFDASHTEGVAATLDFGEPKLIRVDPADMDPVLRGLAGREIQRELDPFVRPLPGVKCFHADHTSFLSMMMLVSVAGSMRAWKGIARVIGPSPCTSGWPPLYLIRGRMNRRRLP